MIEIAIQSFRGEGGLKSMCDIAEALQKKEDCRKIFVIDVGNEIRAGNLVGECSYIARLEPESIRQTMTEKEKTAVVCNPFIDFDGFQKLVRLLSSYESNAREKIYIVYQTPCI